MARATPRSKRRRRFGLSVPFKRDRPLPINESPTLYMEAVSRSGTGISGSTDDTTLVAGADWIRDTVQLVRVDKLQNSRIRYILRFAGLDMSVTIIRFENTFRVVDIRV
jgi:hypothetical protein